MKGDYSQPGLMSGHCSEQIDLPSAYLVYAVGSRLRRQVQRSPGGGPLSYRLISAPFLRDLAEIMVLIGLKGSVNKFFRGIRLACVADNRADLDNNAGSGSSNVLMMEADSASEL